MAKLRDGLARTYTEATDAYLTRKLPATVASGSTLDDWTFIYLEQVPGHGGMVPVISIAYDFTVDPVVVRLRVALFLASQLRAKEGERAFGFRAETPESPSSVHDYYHAQLITSWAKSHLSVSEERLRLPSPQWLPAKQPAFPLEARTGVGLLLNLFGALYAGAFKQKLVGAPFANHLKAHADDLSFLG